MSHFETHPKALKGILTQVNEGDLALPNFQRNFVWDPGATEELIESIMRSYPAGSLLHLKHDGAGFEAREFEGAPPLKTKTSASYLVLDGQQRLTSLYQAFFGKGEHRFFLDLKALKDRGDIEESVWHESLARCQRKGLLDLETQADRLICPLEVLMARKGGFHGWVDEIMEILTDEGEDVKTLRADMRTIHDKWIAPILEYPFPVISLPSSTSLDAVCKMFETLNRRGVKLTVFELLMARSFAEKISLRGMWNQGVEEFSELEDFDIDPYYVLQIISLLGSPTIKRNDVLNLRPKTIEEKWPVALKALGECLAFVRRELGVLSPNLLPYNTMLVPMAATWTHVQVMTGPKVGAAKGKLSQWFWASIFSQAYEQGPTARAVSDYRELVDWIKEDGTEPRALRSLHFNPAVFHEVTPKQRALYRGTLALAVSSGAQDFHNGERLTHEYLEKGKLDDHHLFPQGYLRKKYSDQKVNCVLNRTFIDKKTNIRIKDNAPSRYLSEIQKEIGPEKTRKILESHLIPWEPLMNDDFEGFLAKRAEILFKALEEKMGRPIPHVAPVAEEEDFIEAEEETFTAKDKVDPALVDARPNHLFEGQAPWVGKLFDDFASMVKKVSPEIWWKPTPKRVYFYSPEKNFISMSVSRKGLRLHVFSRGKALENATPIVQKSRGGELWARVKVGRDHDMEKIGLTIRESHTRMKLAIEAKENTSWWAMTQVPESSGDTTPNS